jgi:hypothetical protein
LLYWYKSTNNDAAHLQMDFGVVTPDGSEGLFYFGLTGDVGIVESDGMSACGWTSSCSSYGAPCGPRLHAKDEITVEVSMGIVPAGKSEVYLLF